MLILDQYFLCVESRRRKVNANGYFIISLFNLLSMTRLRKDHQMRVELKEKRYLIGLTNNEMSLLRILSSFERDSPRTHWEQKSLISSEMHSEARSGAAYSIHQGDYL